MHLGLLTQRPEHLSVCHASLAGCMRRHACAYVLHAQDAKCLWACSRDALDTFQCVMPA